MRIKVDVKGTLHACSRQNCIAVALRDTFSSELIRLGQNLFVPLGNLDEGAKQIFLPTIFVLKFT